MIFPFRIFIIVFAILTGMLTSYTVFAQETEPPFDRLDGKGESGKRVDVIEWENNLEIHTYPHTSIKGLSAKIDDRTSGKKVMVLGYRFSEKGRALVRRAILGIPLASANLKAFIDPTEKEFDKLALSNQDLKKPWVPYKLDPSPTQWYPDGDERNEVVTPPVLTDTKNPAEKPAAARAPASAPSSGGAPAPAAEKSVDDGDGSINKFSW